jgi:hypothetical protein
LSRQDVASRADDDRHTATGVIVEELTIEAFYPADAATAAALRSLT